MKIRSLFIISTFLIFSQAQAQVRETASYSDSLNNNILLLKKYLSKGNNWHFTDSLAEKRLGGLIDFVENEPVDTLISYFQKFRSEPEHSFVFRLPEQVSDSLQVAGYLSADQVNQRLKALARQAEGEFSGRQINVPADLFDNIESKVELVPRGEGMRLFTDHIFQLPDSLRDLDAIPDDQVQTAEDFRRILRLDSIRDAYVEQKRQQYNDSIVKAYRNQLIENYRRQLIAERTTFLQGRLLDSVKVNNYDVLKQYNDQVMLAVNDSLSSAVRWMTEFADLIDNTTVSLVNYTNDTSQLVLSNLGRYFTRVWLKNAQNDSLSVLVKNVSKRGMQLVIEDGVTFSRFKQQAVKDFDFATLNKPSSSLDKIDKRYQMVTPWVIGGDGTTGFTQTYMENWKKGGESALSILLVLKGFANYSQEKVKWENSAELRNGWVKPGESKIQKNDDKLQFVSRLGISAFKKWYYSSEANFESQFFNGYKYPNRDKAISGFLAPGRFLFKVGMDYKPNKNFSLFISPITSKSVFVRDTLKVNQTNFGIERGKKSSWEPGFNTDLRFVKEIIPNVTWDTKYAMFFNYLEPADKFVVEWENVLTTQLTDHITMRMMLHTIYDSKILFDRQDKDGKPVLDANGKVIREPKLQLKEFITIGFSYKLNRRVYRAKAIK
ncbi:MAG TPA: DUF3078 domain-containing protein [Prolixibacteraceae bacterium]|nr:DUF3078 domain-containing protein [Prolixibacteraceae bacterium]